MSYVNLSSCRWGPVLVMALGVIWGGCAKTVVEGGPKQLPDEVISEFCVQEQMVQEQTAILLSELLSGVESLSSNLTSEDCGQQTDGYFETWHVYADQTESVVFVAESDFDSLMRFVRVLDIKETPEEGYDVDVEVLSENDDQSADDDRARVAATLEAGEDYFLVLSGFNESETGPYEVNATPTQTLPPPPDTGSVTVTVATEGLPPGLFTVTLGGTKAKSAEANGTVEYEQIVIGTQSVELSGLGDCNVVGDNPQDAVVAANQTATVSFDVDCPECRTADDCDPGGECTVTLCPEQGLCETQTAEDGTGCEYDGGPGQCLEGTCGPTTCPPCIDDDPTDCLAAYCPSGATACGTRPRPVGSDCEKDGKDGKCDSEGLCDVCAGVDCSAPNECQQDSTCNATTGTCNPFANEPIDTPCAQGACDGNGACVECTNADQCPNDTNECTARACDAGQCGQANLGSETTCDFAGTDDGICEDGVCIEVPECGPTVPCNDGNQCTSDTCNAGTCSFDAVPAGASCSDDGVQDGVCDGSGNCVECNQAQDCPADGNPCTTASCNAQQCGQTNVPNGTSCGGGGAICIDSVCGQPPPGAIEVVQVTTATGFGGDDSYTVTIDSVLQGTIGANTSLPYGNIPVGGHIVTLGDISGDCVTEGTPESQLVTVTSGNTATVTFNVRCPPVAPQLLDIDNQLITLNVCGIPNMSTFRYSVDYYDGDGDITPNETRVFIDIRWSDGATQSYESERQFNNISSNDGGFTGAVQALNCLSFGAATYADVTMMVRDANGNDSNPLTTRVPKPAGAF